MSSGSPITVRLARAFAGRADAAPAPLVRWSLDGSLCGGALRAAAGHVRRALAPALSLLDGISHPLAARPLLVIAACALAVPLARIGLPDGAATPAAAALFALAGLAGVLGLAAALHDAPGDAAGRSIVLRALVVGFVLRAALLLVISWRGPFPDETGIYHAMANDTAGVWSLGGTSMLAGHEVTHHREAYFYLLSIAYHVAGSELIVGRVLGGLLGLLVAVLCGEVARALGGTRAAALAVALIALHPEHAFWSITLSRDTLSAVLALTTLVVVLRRPGRFFGMGGLLAIAPFALLSMNFFPLAFALGGALACVACGEAACAIGRTARGLLLPSTVVVGVVTTLTLVGYAWGPYVAPHSFTTIRGSFLSTTDFLPGLVIDHLSDLLWLAPLGALFVLFAPFPWRAVHPQRAAYGAAAVAAHVVTLLGLAGLWHAARKRPSAAAPVIAFLLFALVLFGVVEGQSGIAVRHRLTVTALLAAGAAVLLSGLAHDAPEDS